ncbi:MAG TPA: hypothetical protein VFG86_26690 [Chloroflexota bacterium]|nr:hypothetical protein [Chloroflexota bacterium]
MAPEAVNDVGGGDLQQNGLADWNVNLTGRHDVGTGVLELPPELMACHGDRQARAGRWVGERGQAAHVDEQRSQQDRGRHHQAEHDDEGIAAQ